MNCPGNLLAFAIVIASSLTAQVDSTATFKSGATIIQVPVVVRDHDGRVVDSLKQDDFQLFDDGKKQEIASFSVEGAAQAAPDRSIQGTGAASAMPERFILWYFDDLTIRDDEDLGELRYVATDQSQSMQQNDRIAVFTTSCHVRLDFTGDQQKIKDALRRLQWNPVRECRVADTQSPQLVFLTELVKRMAKLPGKRDIVLISSGFPVGADRSRDEEKLINEAAADQVAINAIDTLEGNATFYRRGWNDGQSGLANPTVLTELARGTGGSYGTRNDHFADFRKLATPESHYVLGFVPAKMDDKVHQLKVKLTNPGKLKVEARKSWYAPKRAE